MNEPEIENSGMVHGTFLSRQQLPRADTGKPYHWTDLNVGVNITVYGKVLRLVKTNNATKDFLEREGIVVGEEEAAPQDPYIQARHNTDHPITSHTTKNDFDQKKQFLVLDRKVLRFHCTWDDPNVAGARLKADVDYYLVDDTIEVREIHTKNNGRDPFPILQRRQKVPRNHLDVPMDFASSVFELSDAEVKDYISPSDFAIGKEVNIFGRKFLVYDMDKFSQEFYRSNFGVQDFDPIDVNDPAPQPVQSEVPPYNGIGSPEDSYLSCVSINPTAPSGQKSLLQLLKYENAILRFEAILNKDLHPDEEGRKFILSIRLADNFVSIFEPPIQNSGIQGGTILSFQRVARTGCNPDQPQFLEPRDFYVGGEIEIYKRTYSVYGCDKFVLSYIDANQHEFTPSAIEATRALFV